MRTSRLKANKTTMFELGIALCAFIVGLGNPTEREMIVVGAMASGVAFLVSINWRPDSKTDAVDGTTQIRAQVVPPAIPPNHQGDGKT